MEIFNVVLEHGRQGKWSKTLGESHECGCCDGESLPLCTVDKDALVPENELLDVQEGIDDGALCVIAHLQFRGS